MNSNAVRKTRSLIRQWAAPLYFSAFLLSLLAFILTFASFSATTWWAYFAEADGPPNTSVDKYRPYEIPQVSLDGFMTSTTSVTPESRLTRSAEFVSTCEGLADKTSAQTKSRNFCKSLIEKAPRAFRGLAITSFVFLIPITAIMFYLAQRAMLTKAADNNRPMAPSRLWKVVLFAMSLFGLTFFLLAFAVYAGQVPSASSYKSGMSSLFSIMDFIASVVQLTLP
jgi:hypothetical protein